MRTSALVSVLVLTLGPLGCEVTVTHANQPNTATPTTTTVATPAAPQPGGWAQQPGCAKGIASGGGQTYALGCSAIAGGFAVYHWNGSNWDKMEGAGTAIAVGSDGIPWVVNADGGVWRRNAANAWDKLPGCAKGIASGGGQTWVLGCGTGGAGGADIYKWNGSNWDKTDGAATAIAVGADGVPWTTGSDGKVWKRNGTTWAAMNGCAKGLAIGTPDNVWALGCSAGGPGGQEVYKYRGPDWDKIDGAAVGLAIDSNASVWAVASDGKVWKR